MIQRLTGAVGALAAAILLTSSPSAFAADLSVNNTSTASNLTASLRISTVGTATPSQPFLFSAANKPTYFAQALVVLPSTSFLAATRTPQHLDLTQLKTVLGKPRIWLIVSNTVSRVGVGDLLPLELKLENATVHAKVIRSLQSFGGAADLTVM